jgi:hypothetical protein
VCITDHIFEYVGRTYLSRHDNVLAGVELLAAAQVHWPVEERDDVGVESLPVRVLEVILLAL